MSTRIFNHISGRLSLRTPQAESLSRLVKAIETEPKLLSHERDVSTVLASLKAEFSTLDDFERDFPSLCFALATGVGKTRLMGAFIAYLHLAHQINHFFILAPSLTIYEKLITDFTPNTPKYVFKGIGELAMQAPRIITGDDYDRQNIAAGEMFGEVRVNIFNISKINSEVRGGKEPKIKRMKEVLGESYFNYLANLPDLVLLMDESHRYRASAGIRAINELKPLMGLELTATPFVEIGSGKKPVQFKNVVMDYPLAKAIEEGFVKEPAVVTQRNFDVKAHSAEEIEKIKLEDGVRLHETTKVELLTYARENAVKIVKPFILVIARDTAHAAALKALIESAEFYEGRYQGKVIQVDSSRSGADEEEMVRRLLAVESVDEPTEIVIHVNMLKEGWDVTNLYTLVPLRAANARTLIEQSIGRGLRLPYGKRTGVAVVDRLNIVAHDKFQEIIDEANRIDSPIRLKQIILDAPEKDERKCSVKIESLLQMSLGLVDENILSDVSIQLTPAGNYPSIKSPVPLFVSEPERKAINVVMNVIRQQRFTAHALSQPEIQNEIAQAVKEQLKPRQESLLENDASIDIAALVVKTAECVGRQTIDIPRILVVPKGEVITGFYPFKLEVGHLNLQPGEREIVGQMLRTNEQFVMAGETSIREQRLEDYLIHALMDFDDIDYDTHADLLYDLAGQMIAHFQNYLSDGDVRRVVDGNRRLLANEIHAQMMAHFWCDPQTEYEVRINQGITELKPCYYAVSANQNIRHYRETVADPIKIKQMLFGGFERCLYPQQKFDSDTERRFAVILERDARKWFKPVKGQFQIDYKLSFNHCEYIPDFIAETDTEILMIETKAKNELSTDEVKAKAEAAALWCAYASDYVRTVGGKPWSYLLIPHNEVTESKHLIDYLSFFVRAT